MTSALHRLPSLTLTKATWWFAASFIAVITAICLIFVALRGERFTDSALDVAVRVRTNAAASELARTLEQDWRDLVYLAQNADVTDTDRLGDVIMGASGDHNRISWLGFADLSGRVVAATNGMLLGQNVAERPWYLNGLNGGFAGDVHDALLLAKLLGGDSDEPLRFIDLAQPVLDSAGDPVGVMGMHINAAWLQSHLRETARTMGVDLFLISPDGSVSASSVEADASADGVQILRQAQAGIQSHGRETWPDGREYFSTLVPHVGHGDLPNFGWRMVGRLDAGSVNLGLDLVNNGAHYALGMALAVLALLTGLFALFVMKPFERLGQSSAAIAEGAQDYPANSRVTREAAQLSAALTRLQQDRISEDR